ncbi:MAG: type II toxin-antitoxin system VapB family antitoxin [Myxococcota bacterium]|jgi:Arc/MetJ family transcription regulator
MRTTVNISDTVIKDLMRFTHARTQTEAVNSALVDWVRRQRLDRLKSLRGKLQWDGDIDELRSLEMGEGGG